MCVCVCVCVYVHVCVCMCMCVCVCVCMQEWMECSPHYLKVCIKCAIEDVTNEVSK